MPLISVIIPVYNSQKYLKKCMDSVINQTFDDIEIICVDDGSDDDSLSILEEYSKTDNRLKIISKEHQEGTGAGPARNIGFDNSVGKYVIFLDSDDFFKDNMLEQVYNCAEKNSAEIVVFDAYFYDNNTDIVSDSTGIFNIDYVPDRKCFSGKDAAGTLFQFKAGAAWNMLIARNFVKEKNLFFQSARMDDAKFTYIALAEAKRISVVNERLLYYRVNLKSNQTAAKYNYIENMYEMPLALEAELKSRALYDTFEITFLNNVFPVMISYIVNQKDEKSFKSFYNLFKEKIAPKLNVQHYLSLRDDNIINISAQTVCQNIMNYSADMFIKKKNNCEFFPKIIKDKKIIIYGAGEYGKKTYYNLKKSNVCSIEAWVDKNYNNIGFPVESPDVIHQKKFDYIMLSIADKKVIMEIKKMLTDHEISEDKIIEFSSL